MDDLGPKAHDLCRVLLLLITINHNSSLSPAIWSPAFGAHGLTVQVWVVLLFALNRACLPWPSRVRQMLILGITPWFARDKAAWTVMVAKGESKARFLSFLVY